MEWLNLPVEALAKAGGWGLFALGLVGLLVAQWKGLIVGGAEHRRALAERDTWRGMAERQGDRLDVIQDTLSEVMKSQQTIEQVVRALPRGAGRR